MDGVGFAKDTSDVDTSRIREDIQFIKDSTRVENRCTRDPNPKTCHILGP